VPSTAVRKSCASNIDVDSSRPAVANKTGRFMKSPESRLLIEVLAPSIAVDLQPTKTNR
jgi:hypothetical protein